MFDPRQSSEQSFGRASSCFFVVSFWGRRRRPRWFLFDECTKSSCAAGSLFGCFERGFFAGFGKAALSNGVSSVGSRLAFGGAFRLHSVALRGNNQVVPVDGVVREAMQIKVAFTRHAMEHHCWLLWKANGSEGARMSRVTFCHFPAVSDSQRNVVRSHRSFENHKDKTTLLTTHWPINHPERRILATSW